MKKVLLLTIFFILTSCAVKPAKEHIKNQKPQTIVAKESYKKVYGLLKDKMLKCYEQKKGKYHIMGEGEAEQKTFFSLNKKKKVGVIYYQHKTEFDNEILFYIKVQNRGPASSEIELYGKGKGLRTQDELKENLQKWLKGKKAYCIGRGDF